MSFHTDVARVAEENEYFRRVVFTGNNSQLVVMAIPGAGEIGEEVHEHVEQTLYFQSGNGEAVLNGEVFPIKPGDVFVVTPGTKHNFKNTGEDPLKIITVYAPPNHIDGTVHRTKADADADEKDEAFGHAQK